MPITSVVVECQQDQTHEVRRQVDNLPNTEITKIEGDLLVVVTDTDSQKQDHALVRALADLTGVISAVPVFTNCEDLAEGIGIAPALAEHETHAPMEV